MDPPIRLLHGIKGPREVGREFGVRGSTVAAIWERRIWGWLSDEAEDQSS